jgi:hypothetical protein
MRGHELRRAGRIDEAIVEFRAADALESAYFTAEKIPVESPGTDRRSSARRDTSKWGVGGSSLGQFKEAADEVERGEAPMRGTEGAGRLSRHCARRCRGNSCC